MTSHDDLPQVVALRGQLTEARAVASANAASAARAQREASEAAALALEAHALEKAEWELASAHAAQAFERSLADTTEAAARERAAAEASLARAQSEIAQLETLFESLRREHAVLVADLATEQVSAMECDGVRLIVMDCD